MVEGLAKQAFKGWDLTRGCWPRERGKERKARQGGRRQDGTSGRCGPGCALARVGKGSPSAPSPAPLRFPAPCIAEGCRSPARSPTSLPSLPPGTRRCGLPVAAALSPPPPFVSKARE